MTSKLSWKFIKIIAVFAFPVMLQQFISAFGNLVDNLMVGKLGQEAIVAVGASNQIFFVVMLIGFGISEGTSIFIAQQFGSKQFTIMKQTFSVGIISSLIVGSLCALGVFLFQEQLITRFTTVPAEIELAKEYLSIALLTYPIILMNIAMASAFRSCSNTFTPMVFGILTIVINTTLNYILIYGHLGFEAYGVAGAAIATLISRVFDFVGLSTAMVYKKMPFVPRLRDLRNLSSGLLRNLAKKTIPLISNEFLWGFGMATLMATYGSRQSSDYAGVQIAYTTANLMFVVMGGFAVSVSILVGQSLGKNDLEEAKNNAKLILKVSFLSGLCVSVLTVILSFFVPYLYNVTAEVRDLSAHTLLVIAFFMPIYCLLATLFFILRAGGDVKGVLIMDSLILWVLIVPTAVILMKYTAIPILFVYICVQSIDFFKLFIGFRRFNKGIWIKNLVH